MTAAEQISIVTEVIQEVESYLPDMSSYLHALASSNTDHEEETGKELHRMTHTIKGTAAMVQLEELSKTAALMEDVLDDILAGQQGWNKQVIQVMSNTVNDIGSYCIALHKDTPDGVELYHTARAAFEEIKDTFSVQPAVATELSQEEGDLLAFLDGNEDDEPDDAFLQHFSGEEESAVSEDDLAMLLGSSVSDPAEIKLEELLGIESDDPGEFDSDEETVELLPSAEVSIDQELQESFDEEAEEHLDNIGRQLNELASAISERTAVSEEFRERLHSIRRSVHTLKGAAAVIGIEPVAAWGHDFEDFLDSLHDESDTISPRSIAAMQDGADILEKIALNPNVDVSSEISTLQDIFPTITADAAVNGESIPEKAVPQTAKEQESPEPALAPDIPVESGKETSEEHALHDRAADSDEGESFTDSGPTREHIFSIRKEGSAKHFSPIRIAGSKNKRKQARTRTLRVGSEKIAELMGLSGDMAINLSSFENSSSSMQSGLNEFEITLQRLKGIVSRLETGDKQRSIPNLAAPAENSLSRYGTADEFDPLEMDHYSEFHILLNSLNEAVVDLESISSQAFGVHDSWRLAVDRQRRIVGDVQGAVQSIQMTPFSTLSNRLYKTVRESARVTEKQVRLLIEGGSMEMDTHIWNVLADALMHMLRNCVDHGIESADERLLIDKPEQATIQIKCSRQGSHFVLRLSDDGGGLNYDAIRNRALTLYPETDVEGMNNKELAALIFRQGFSIRPKVTSISGRGVGMDVVRNALDQLNGFIEVSSDTGQGTEFILSMPIAVAQLPALMVMFGKQQFAVPMRDISSVLRLSPQERQKETFTVNDESFPLLRPAELMALEGSPDLTGDRDDCRDSSLALAVETSGRRGLLVADAIIGQRNVVFKSLGSHLQNISCVAGATILGDGSLVPILQTEDLFNLAETAAQCNDTAGSEKYGDEKTVEILIVDDSISIRKVLGNFITAQGWQPTTAHDGVDAINKIKERKPDLVILDIEMPRMNGFEVLQTLQSQSAYRDLPVLMLTSRSAVKYREKAAGLGARGFVTKPFKDEELTSLISSLTTQKLAKGPQY